MSKPYRHLSTLRLGFQCLLAAAEHLALTLPSVKQLPTWVPGAGFKREAFRIRGMVHNMMQTPYEMVKNAVVRAGRGPDRVPKF